MSVLILWAVPFDRNAILVDQEFLEVPGDVSSSNWRPFNWHRVWLYVIDEVCTHTRQSSEGEGNADLRYVQRALRLRRLRRTLPLSGTLEHSHRLGVHT